MEMRCNCVASILCERFLVGWNCNRIALGFIMKNTEWNDYGAITGPLIATFVLLLLAFGTRARHQNVEFD